MSTEAEHEYEIPLRDQRNFGRGYRKRGIAFVKQVDGCDGTNIPSNAPLKTRSSASEKYLAIAFRSDPSRAISGGNDRDHRGSASSADLSDDTTPEFCSTCQIEIATTERLEQHFSSIAHQVRLSHSRAPSHLDRHRMGLNVLQAHGWDPDEGKGLGLQQAGILYPIKAKENLNRAGLGAHREPIRKVEKPNKLNAGQIRNLQKLEKARSDILRREIFGSSDLDRYLEPSKDG